MYPCGARPPPPSRENPKRNPSGQRAASPHSPSIPTQHPPCKLTPALLTAHWLSPCHSPRYPTLPCQIRPYLTCENGGTSLNGHACVPPVLMIGPRGGAALTCASEIHSRPSLQLTLRTQRILRSVQGEKRFVGCACKVTRDPQHVTNDDCPACLTCPPCLESRCRTG